MSAQPPCTDPTPVPVPTLPTFAIGNINPGTVRSTFMQSVLECYSEFATSGLTHIILTHSGPYLDDGRNKCVQRFLNETDADILLFVDSDVEFTSDHVRKILSHDFSTYPVVSGYYRSLFADGWSPVVYIMQTPDLDSPKPGWLNERDSEGNPVPEMANIGDDGWDKLPNVGNDLHLCHVVGAGFLAISRPFLEKMGKMYGRPCPWFAEGIDLDRKVHMGEDTTFCARVYEMGEVVAVDNTIGLVHTKSIAVSPFPSPTGSDLLLSAKE